MKELHILTKEAEKHYKQQSPKTIILKEKEITFKKLNKYKKQISIIIFDITTTNTNKKQLFVKDHINKTGKNPLRGKQQTTKNQFTDLTTIYKKGKVITTSLGKRFNKKKHTEKYPSTQMSNIAIICKSQGHANIKGRLININQKKNKDEGKDHQH